jgi:hypothetical protein
MSSETPAIPPEFVSGFHSRNGLRVEWENRGWALFPSTGGMVLLQESKTAQGASYLEGAGLLQSRLELQFPRKREDRFFEE